MQLIVYIINKISPKGKLKASKILIMRNKKFYNFAIMSLQNVHIGQEIKKVFDESGIKMQAFADKIFYSRQNVNGIFKRSSVDTDLLIKISNALNFDFFKFYRVEETNFNTVSEPDLPYKTVKKGSGYSVSITINVDDYLKGKQILELIGLRQ